MPLLTTCFPARPRTTRRSTARYPDRPAGDRHRGPHGPARPSPARPRPARPHPARPDPKELLINAPRPPAADGGSGILQLTLADNGAGFTTAISNLAPGDTVNRFDNLSNGGTLDASALSLKVADTVNSKLTTDTTNGLNVTVSTCPVAWTTAGACTSPTTVITTVPLSTLKTTPSPVLPSLTAGASAYLRFSPSCCRTSRNDGVGSGRTAP